MENAIIRRVVDLIQTTVAPEIYDLRLYSTKELKISFGGRASKYSLPRIVAPHVDDAPETVLSLLREAPSGPRAGGIGDVEGRHDAPISRPG